MANYGDTLARQIDNRIAASTATLTTLKAIPAAARIDQQVCMVQADGSLWRFILASSLTGDDILVVTPTAGSGAWFRVNEFVDVTAAATFATADAAILWTVPTGFVVRLGIPFWKVGTSWTGGSSSAIGLSSSNSALATKGDLLGGSGGDVAAGLLSTGAYAKGTVGALIGTPKAVLNSAETVRFDRITSVFTAGTATAHIPVQVLVVPAS